jgi:hypothetical protein
MPNQDRHKDLTFLVANFAILPKKKKKKKKKKEKRLGKLLFLSFRCVFFPTKKRMSQIFTFTIIYLFKKKIKFPLKSIQFFQNQIKQGRGVSHDGWPLPFTLKK